MDISDALTGIAAVVLIVGGIPMGLGVGILVAYHSGETADPDRFCDATRRRANTVTAALAVMAGVLLWAVWISWGNYRYPTWAIVGCVISSLVVVIGLGFLSRWRGTGPFVAALGGLFGFSTACAVQMGLDDYENGDGLWGVGYLIIVVCGGVVLTVIAAVVALVRLRSRPRTPSEGRP